MDGMGLMGSQQQRGRWVGQHMQGIVLMSVRFVEQVTIAMWTVVDVVDSLRR